MLFGEIDLPEALVIAQSEGRLVVFAGAGVSQGDPSSLPDFAGLAAIIAQRSLTETEKDRLDHFLGELEDRKVDVHARALDALRRPGSAPTPLHEALVGLFDRVERLRVVTTNIDPHFTTVVRQKFPAALIYTAPALPRGGNFNGLVQLHGADTGPAGDLVLTDRDFGKAYLTEGWARSFVERLFAEYTVLFVGYSLKDPPLHYLARGLPGDGKDRRFALVTDADTDRWQRLGVTPIVVPRGAAPDIYAPLTHGVKRWVDVTRGSGFVLEQQIIQILAQPDPKAISPADAALVEWSLGQNHTVSFFTANANGLPWVSWLASRRKLDSFFDPLHRFVHARERQLAAWLADQLIKHPVSRSLTIVHALGARFSRDFYRALTHRSYQDDTPVEWVALLAQQLDGVNRDVQSFFGHKLRKLAVAASSAYLPLLQVLTTPRLGLESNALANDPDEAHLTFEITGEAGEVWSAWTDGVRLRLPDDARALLDLLLAQLERAAQLAASVGNAEGFYRRATHWRPHIAEMGNVHHQGHHADVLIDMLVEIIGHLSHTTGGLGEPEIQRWFASENRILRRLGVHALAESVDLTTEAKLAALNVWIARWPDRAVERREAEWRRDRLTTPVKLLPAAPPELPPATEPLRPVAELLAMQARELHNHMRRVRLTAAEGLQQLNALVALDPVPWGHPVWDHLLNWTPWTSLDEAGRTRLLELLRTPFPLAQHRDAVTRCLFEADPLSGDTTLKPTTAQIAALFELSRQLWPLYADENDTERPRLQADWDSLALNHVTFRMVLFWLKYASLQPHETDNPSLPQELAAIFTDACQRASDTARRVQATLAQEIAFLMARDPDWVTQQLLTHFDFERRGDQAWVVWQPFLEHGRLSRPLALAMLPRYQIAQSRLLAADEEVINGYLEDAAALTVHIIEAMAWLKSLLPALKPIDRARWARLVDREMDGLTDEQQSGLWNRWLRQYWRERNTGLLGDRPLPFSGQETAIMARWVLALPAVFPEAFALLRAGPAPDFTAESFAWREIGQSTALAARHPHEFVAFLEFMTVNRDLMIYHESIVEVTEALPRIPELRSGLLRIAERMLHDGWRGARNYKEWVEREFPE